MQENLFENYERELKSLKQAAQQWLQDRPQLAQALDFDADIQQDPFVKRLVDSFAFLTARLQTKLESNLPTVATAMLETLLPLYTRPIPAFGIVQLETNTQLDGMSGPLRIRRPPIRNSAAGESFEVGEIPEALEYGGEGSNEEIIKLELESDAGIQFRAVTDVCFWNLAVKSCDYSQQFAEMPPLLRTEIERRGFLSGIKLQLKSGGPSLKDVFQRPSDGSRELEGSDPHSRVIRFYLRDPDLQYELQAALFDPRFGRQAVLHSTSGGLCWLPEASVREVGLAETHGPFVLPAPPTMPLGYRLIFEMFAFPQRFLFFDLEVPRDWKMGEERHFEVYLFFRETFERFQNLRPDSILLNCCPVVNLSEVDTPAVPIDPYVVDLPLDANLIGDDSEIQAISQMKGRRHGDGPRESLPLHPFFTAQQYLSPAREDRFFFVQRKPRLDQTGTDLDVSVVDATWNPFVEAGLESVSARLWVCHRTFLKRVERDRRRLKVAGAGFVTSAQLVGRDWSLMQLPRSRDRALWDLVAVLNLNHLLLAQGLAKDTLKQLLAVLNPIATDNRGSAGRQANHPWIDAIADVRVEERIVGRIDAEPWGGFATGTRLTVELDMNKIDNYRRGSYFLLGRMIDQLLAMQTGINTFVEVGLKTPQDTKAFLRFPKRCGNRRLI